jgi:hypothetical protein
VGPDVKDMAIANDDVAVVAVESLEQKGRPVGLIHKRVDF